MVRLMLKTKVKLMHAELMHELKRYFRSNVRSTNTMNQSHSENVTQPACRTTGFKCHGEKTKDQTP